MACPRIRETLYKRRWLIRRLQGFASIRCDTDVDNAIDYGAPFTLMAKLSGAFTKGTDLTMVLT